jgi:hypothetical protein
MPILDAKALETDPEGMAFLRAVIRPKSEKEEPGSSLVTGARAKRRVRARRCPGEAPNGSVPAETGETVAPA